MVKQVKVLRDADKVNAAGKQASKGLAFVEFSEHEHALCALRQLNNNPAPFGALLSPCVTSCTPCTVLKASMHHKHFVDGRGGAAADHRVCNGECADAEEAH